MLVTSIFSFSHNVFCSLKETFQVCFYFDVCKSFPFVQICICQLVRSMPKRQISPVVQIFVVNIFSVMDKTELFSSCKTVGMYYLTLPSINTHFNTSKKKALGKHRGKKVKLLKMSNFTFFSQSSMQSVS